MNSPKKLRVRKGVEISDDNLKWFYQEFGDDASLSWYINLLMTAAKELHDNHYETPVEVIRKATNAVKEIEHEL